MNLRKSDVNYLLVVLAFVLPQDCYSQTDALPHLSTPIATASSNQSAKLSLETGSRTLKINGVSRTFTLYVPKNHNPAVNVPLVLDYHGIFGTGVDQMNSSGYKQVADREGFLVAYPDGIDKAWNIGPCCTFSREVDDVAFARAIVAQVKREAKIADKQIYAAGFSNGGGMAQYLGCHAADLFAAIAPSAFDLLEENSPDCKPSRPIPILITRGMQDNFVTYAGGPSNPPNGLKTTIHFMGAAATFKRWAEINQCSTKIVKDNTGCEIHTACASGVEVGLCSVPNGGHVPGDANAGWAFLTRFKLP